MNKLDYESMKWLIGLCFSATGGTLLSNMAIQVILGKKDSQEFYKFFDAHRT